MFLSGTDMSMASFTRSTTSTSAVIAGDRVAVLVFLAPKFYFFLLGTFDASLAHLDVVLDLCFRELSVLPEDDVEAQAEYAKCDKNDCCKKYLHCFINIPSASGFCRRNTYINFSS